MTASVLVRSCHVSAQKSLMASHHILRKAQVFTMIRKPIHSPQFPNLSDLSFILILPPPPFLLLFMVALTPYGSSQAS